MELTNKVARLNGLMKMESYESDTFVDETWRGLKSLYEQLHACHVVTLPRYVYRCV